MVNLTVLTWIRFRVWMVAGVVDLLGYGRRHSVLAAEAGAIRNGARILRRS